MVKYLPKHSYIGFEYRNYDIMIKDDVPYDELDRVTELWEVSHHRQCV